MDLASGRPKCAGRYRRRRDEDLHPTSAGMPLSTEVDRAEFATASLMIDRTAMDNRGDRKERLPRVSTDRQTWLNLSARLR